MRIAESILSTTKEKKYENQLACLLPFLQGQMVHNSPLGRGRSSCDPSTYQPQYPMGFDSSLDNTFRLLMNTYHNIDNLDYQRRVIKAMQYNNAHHISNELYADVVASATNNKQTLLNLYYYGQQAND